MAQKINRKWLTVIAVNGFVILLFLIGAEVLLRRHFNRPALFEGESHYRYHELLGWAPKPGSYIRDYGTVTISPEGFRVWTAAEEDNASGTILVCGDSFTFGAFVSDRETWPYYLSSLTGRRVINAGVSGYGLDQIVLRADREVENLKPDLLIISIIPDDVHRCIMSRRERFKPYFDQVGDRLVLRHNPVPRPFFRPSAYRWHERSLLLKLAIAAFKDKIPGKIEYTANDVRKISLLLFRRIFYLNRRWSIPLVVIFQPESPKLPRHPWETGLVLKEFLRELGVPVLDLHPAFQQRFPGEDQRRDLFSARGHLTGEGNRWLAEQIATFLKKRRLLEPVNSDRSVVPEGKKSG